MDDEALIVAMQRCLSASSHVLALGDDMEDGLVIGKRFVLVDLDSPVAAKLFASFDELREEVEDIVQQSLSALGARRYVNAIGRGDLDRDDFLALAGENGEEWLAKGERAILGQSVGSVAVAVGVTTSVQKARL